MAFVLHLPIVIPYIRKVFDFVFFCFRLDIFTNKISNLLLPLGATAQNLDVPNQYRINTFMMLFNDLFIYFGVAFPLFGASNDLIKDS